MQEVLQFNFSGPIATIQLGIHHIATLVTCFCSAVTVFFDVAALTWLQFTVSRGLTKQEKQQASKMVMCPAI